MQRLSLLGRQFERLSVIAFAGTSRHGHSLWLCKCECGNEITVAGIHLTRHHTRSCGCLKLELLTSRSTKHGHATRGAHDTTYQCWRDILRRCEDTKAKAYPDYGGRGIAVCERWHKFESFLADMGERPEGAEIDRQDNEGSYEPSNCRWVSRAENARNKRTTRLLTYGGETLCFSDMAAKYSLHRKTLERRLQLGWSLERALTTPPTKRRAST